MNFDDGGRDGGEGDVSPVRLVNKEKITKYENDFIYEENTI